MFAKAAPSAVTHLAEIRSAVEKGGKTVSTMQVKIFRQTSAEKGGTTGQPIRTSLPYIRNDIPIVVVFRALGIINDQEILDHICYDRGDAEMFEMVKPCLEEAFPIQEEQHALDFIGRRGTTTGLDKDRRILYAKEILQKEMLPHISMAEGHEGKKGALVSLNAD